MRLIGTTNLEAMGLNSIRLYEIECDQCGVKFPGSDGSQPDGAVYDSRSDAIDDLLITTWQATTYITDPINDEPTRILTRAICPNCTYP